ncbi:hypothetical protein [Sphingobacterium griseoflavum]|uniref:hypothetical protein n=1 Tax=Sphingobacterium griseoflavum TaxID=1474952 RepID=UPI001675BA4C|nr:hypothetical protein [Sphingobacterium griseoflavum]
MNTKAISYFSVLLGIYFTIYTGILYKDPTFVIVIVIMALLSLIYKPELRQIYLTALFSCVTMGAIMIGVFQESGSFFDLGGDDSKFFRYFLEASDGNTSLYQFRYGNYLALGSGFVSLLKIFGLVQITPLSVYPLNWFIGANVCVATFFLAKRFGLDSARSKMVAILLSIYPFFVFYEVKILRDIFSGLLLMSFLLLYTSRLKIIVRICFMAVIALICLKVRGEFILYMVGYVGVDKFCDLYYSNQRYKAIFLALIAGVVLLFSYNIIIGLSGREANEVSELSESYQASRTSESSEGSLGAKLKSGGPIFTPIIMLYMWLSPFPPPFFLKQNAYNLIISVGVIFWYLSCLKMPFYISSFYKRSSNTEKRRVISKLLIYIALVSAMIALTSADSRHLISFYPLAFISFALLKQDFPLSRYGVMNFLVAIGVVIIITIYFILKIF